ncbi:hypothetical protein [Nakamurella endophytica]|uniref:DUF385 domain-containing protein n=1 Tax=Nakamurella endophytica TaxID=1748367 RepID=A0A917SU54_9ACTN|nr:hypothetical protein [Nakamurella endophytica]GGL98384.1 hypothetical protein GCM10011594_17840 [Nakamurella endophytica]
MTQPRATTLRFQKAANRLVTGLLHVPLLSRAIGSRLVVLDVVGVKSGRRYSVPVAYTRDGDDLLVGTPFAWGRNLRTGRPITLLLKGKRVTADVTVFTDEAGVTAAYATMARDNGQFAKFNKISVDASGAPDPADLRLAWQGGARAVRLRPRFRRENSPTVPPSGTPGA